MKSDLENKIEKMRSEFDFAEPSIGHFERFEAKLKYQKARKHKNKLVFRSLIAVAASVLLLIGFFLGQSQHEPKALELADVSPEMAETQSFYTVSIQKEIERINQQKNPENTKIIEDAFAQIHILENSYKELTLQLKESNEDKRVIFAMISNFQQRIEVLQNLLEQLELLEQFKSNPNEVII